MSQYELYYKNEMPAQGAVPVQSLAGPPNPYLMPNSHVPPYAPPAYHAPHYAAQFYGYGAAPQPTLSIFSNLTWLHGLFLGLGAAWIIYLMSQKQVRRNPSSAGGSDLAKVPAGKNSIAKSQQRANGTWWYKLLRKNARAQGPFGSEADMLAAANARGIRIMGA